MGNVDAPPLRLLVVCTANQCRSPLGEVIARDLFARRGVPASVTSAGTRAGTGVPATDGAVIAARKLGLDLTEHRSRPASPYLTAEADLLITMERQHVLDLVAESGAPLPVTFTLPELAALAAAHPSRDADETVVDWIARIGAGRTPMSVLTAGEIDDPIGRPQRRYHAAARLIAEALEQVLDGLAPSEARRADPVA